MAQPGRTPLREVAATPDALVPIAPGGEVAPADADLRDFLPGIEPERTIDDWGYSERFAGLFDRIGVSVVFTTTAVVIAICFVAGPFYVRQAIAAFETLDKDVLDAARVDGAGPFRVLMSVSVPLASAGLAAGAALAFARGVGEFGATIMFAGNLRGTTQTLPLLIYQDFEVSFDLSLAISALLFAIGFLGVLIRRNTLVVFMCLELMLVASTLALVAFSRFNGTMDGNVFVFFIFTVAAAEVAVGLAIIVALFRQRRTIQVDELNSLKN